MADISINGYKLHKIQMRLPPSSENSVSYLIYPEHRMQFDVEGDQLFLKVPAFVVLELYRKEIISQDKTHSLFIEINNNEVGEYKISDLQYPNGLSQDRDLVTITLVPVAQAHL